eukprot:CAMPEP_0168166548 /NCGR_PEP_ID=MMETSP0139_2-20121125/2085_1 /TAXON_ID=44445 /ORGANISM="Pseudo-nitzschia australis, Strain 10249 10 AB" /LENGTH=768 /DNA_ID=CAMNT_0008083751 /DNA_START=176 /DNA_END=2483 /DNA_ORIENTATION=-
MNIQAELAAAMKKQHSKVYGTEHSSNTAKNNRNAPMRQKETTVSKADRASRSAAKKSAAAALAAKFGAKPVPSLPASAASNSPKRTFSKISPKTSAKRAAEMGPLNEEEISQKYRKMVNVGLPEGAIRHKMISDGVSESIIEAVISGKSSVPSTSTTVSRSSATSNKKQTSGRAIPAPSLSPEEENIAAQYRRMFRVKMPEGAVRHKMAADGVSAKIQESVLARESPTSPTTTSASRKAPRASSLSPEEENIASQYRTMLKIKMPEGAVRHKMTLNGDTPAASSSPLSSSLSLPSKSNKSTQNVSSLSIEDEAVATQYRKMMKMRMPEGAVRHKMTKDGIAAHIQDSVIRGETPAENSSGGVGGSDLSASNMPPRPLAHPMSAAISSSGGIGALKNTTTKKKDPVPPAMSSNPMTAAITASGGIGGLKKTTARKKEPAPPAIPSNPMAAHIAASGGVGGLKKTTTKKNEPIPPSKPSNPMAAAIAASRGVGGLKKTTKGKKKPTSPSKLSNPMAAAIAASGGVGDLKKTTAKKKEAASPSMPSNPMARPKARTKATNNTLIEKGFSPDLKSGFKKTPLESKERPPKAIAPTNKGFPTDLKSKPKQSSRCTKENKPSAADLTPDLQQQKANSTSNSLYTNPHNTNVGKKSTPTKVPENLLENIESGPIENLRVNVPETVSVRKPSKKVPFEGKRGRANSDAKGDAACETSIASKRKNRTEQSSLASGNTNGIKKEPKSKTKSKYSQNKRRAPVTNADGADVHCEQCVVM